MKALLLALAVAASIALTGCTGIPGSSAPEALGTLGPAAPSASPAITPTPNADPRTIVSEFLSASASDDPHHVAARGFLTKEAAQGWLDTTVTVVDFTTIRTFNGKSVLVTGHDVGSIDATGVYTPSLQGASDQFEFEMGRVAGQWRIGALQNGLVVDSNTFQQLYQQHPLYFFDLAEQHLVPDPRYSAISDPALLANWLVARLADGPRDALHLTVRNELPAATASDPGRVTVTFDAPIQVQVPGAAQLVPVKRNRLAAQIAISLRSVVGGSFSIVDSGQAITIPAANGDRFASTDFDTAIAPQNESPALYYVAGGRVVDEQGKPIAGRAGDGSYDLTSVALASTSSPDLRIAGTSGSGTTARLLVGTANTGLNETSIRGRLSRPTWAPGLDEVWVGDGSRIYRVGLNGRVHGVPFEGVNGPIDAQVTALRFSPEGSRVAMVLTTSTADGPSAQVWVGSVFRAGGGDGQVRIDSPTPISPQGVVVTDVAWNDQLKLFTIGRVTASGESNVFEVQVDGSLWTPRTISNLPEAPDSITVAENEVAWVSAGGTVWAQSAGSWASPHSGPTNGTNPVYLE